MKNFYFDDIYSQPDDIDSGLYGIEYDLQEMIDSLSHRNRLTRKKFYSYDETLEREKRKRNRIRRKSEDFEPF